MLLFYANEAKVGHVMAANGGNSRGRKWGHRSNRVLCQGEIYLVAEDSHFQGHWWGQRNESMFVKKDGGL